MKQLIDEGEAGQRIRISHIISARKAYGPVKQENQYLRAEKDEVIRQELLQMRQNGMSNNEIAKKSRLDLRKVDRLIGKNEDKSKAIDFRKQQVMDMTASGKTASEISRDLGISVSTVRRIRAEKQ